jgi:hypothetical protein
MRDVSGAFSRSQLAREPRFSKHKKGSSSSGPDFSILTFATILPNNLTAPILQPTVECEQEGKAQPLSKRAAAVCSV